MKIRYLENSILINDEILVFSDFHMGYEEAMYGKEFFLRIQYNEIIEKLDNLFKIIENDMIKIDKIIILGDLKHEFGQISDVEWRETLELVDYLLKKCNELILIKGNHDNILGPIAKKRGIDIKDYLIIEDIGFLHGNKWFLDMEKCKSLFVGHLHPAITLNDKYKTEKYKCFLKGKYKKKEIYILPSFVPLNLGYDITNNIDSYEKNKRFLFFENKILKKFEVVVYNEKEDKIFDLGVLKEIEKM